MTRRSFSGAALAAVALPTFPAGEPSRVVILKAIAGAHLPATLTISTSSPEKLQRGLWELRTYRMAAPVLASLLGDIFTRTGIQPLLSGMEGPNLTYLIPFENLTARDQAWTAVNADPQWIGARAQFQAYHFGLYRSV